MNLVFFDLSDKNNNLYIVKKFLKICGLNDRIKLSNNEIINSESWQIGEENLSIETLKVIYENFNKIETKFNIKEVNNQSSAIFYLVSSDLFVSHSATLPIYVKDKAIKAIDFLIEKNYQNIGTKSLKLYKEKLLHFYPKNDLEKKEREIKLK